MKELNALLDRKNKLEEKQRIESHYRAGIISSVIANCNRDSKKKPDPFTPEDFMPEFEKKEKKEQTVEEQKEYVKILNSMFGGTVGGGE